MTDAPPQPRTGADRSPRSARRHQWESLPRRIVTVYMPLICFLVVLLFPFYWMAVTTLQVERGALQLQGLQPVLGRIADAGQRQQAAVRDRLSAWLTDHDDGGGGGDVPLDLRQRARRLRDPAAALQGQRTIVGPAIYLAYLVPPSILFIPLATMVFQLGLYDSPMALILTYPTFLIPFCTWLLIGYFKSIPYELEECALIDGATRIQILWRITLPLGRARA